MSTLFYERQPYLMLDHPQLLLNSISSSAYIKRTAGTAYYTPPADILSAPGVDGPAITSNMMSSAALGAAGVRLYQFEAPSNLVNRIKAPVGSMFQTGANPTANDPIILENWRAMAYAANPLTKTLLPYVLGNALTSPSYGRDILTAARQGPGGRLLMVVNDNGWPRTIGVDFTPYRTGKLINRYLISSDGIRTDVVPDGPGELIRLAAGESAVYLFPAATGAQVTSVFNVAPSSGARRAILHYGYIYKESLRQQLTGIDCTRGCTLHLDRRLGPFYYQFTYLDSFNSVAGRSPVMTLFE
jgi:hypothetical protein